jgi:hypothetical protein
MLAELAKTLAVLEPHRRSFPWQPGKPSVDVVIPCNATPVDFLIVDGQLVPLGLDMTFRSCVDELANSGLQFHIFVVDNGNETSGVMREALELCYQQFEHLTVLRSGRPLDPPGARNLGAGAGNGDLIFFLDAHCKLDPGFFVQAIKVYELFFADSVRGVTRNPLYKGGEYFHYHHTSLLRPPKKRGRPLPLSDFFCRVHLDYVNPIAAQRWVGKLPYRCLSSGHGAFSVRRDTWEEVDGYWDGFKGFGGEEFYFDYKLAMLRYSTWLNPNIGHFHHLIDKDYKQNELEQVANFISVFNILDYQGPELARIKKPVPYFKDDPTFVQRALDRSERRAKWLLPKKKWSYQQMTELFERAGVAM